MKQRITGMVQTVIDKGQDGKRHSHSPPLTSAPTASADPPLPASSTSSFSSTPTLNKFQGFASLDAGSGPFRGFGHIDMGKAPRPVSNMNLY